MQEQWVMSLRDQCKSANIPFSFKQWGGVRKKAAGRALGGRTCDAMPERRGLISLL
jgi:protein gp37